MSHRAPRFARSRRTFTAISAAARFGVGALERLSAGHAEALEAPDGQRLPGRDLDGVTKVQPGREQDPQDDLVHDETEREDPPLVGAAEKEDARRELAGTLAPKAGYERLGEALLRRGVISAEQLERALAMQRASGERLGRVLLTIGALSRQEMHAVLAETWGVPFVDLLLAGPSPDLVRTVDPELMSRAGWVPLSRRDDEAMVATSEPPDTQDIAEICGALDVSRVRFAATTDWDIQNVIREVFSEQIAHRAAYGLSEQDPEQSALSGFSLWQKIAGLTLVAAILIGALIDWVATLTIVCSASSLIFLAAVLFKVVAVSVAWRGLRRGEQASARIPDAELPVYTVLVPVYKEANIVGGLVSHLSQLDYPKEKLEILLLMEEDDLETIAAARAAAPPEMVRFVIIPEGIPKTKPRACNVGLFFARGEYLVIYDAEDRPERGQLRDAVAAFRAASDEVACIQARLNYFNAGENTLTRMFTLEYSFWFDYMLPGLDAMGLPIPLGGTSNHFRTDRLRELGGWDAFNVTEDADLGLRANAEGYRVGVIASTTYEEACSKTWPWVRQRTRWIKGYMQTSLVHSRRPLRFLRTCGLRGLVGFGLLIFGTPLIFLINPILWSIFVVWLVGEISGQQLLPDVFPGIWWYVALVSLVAGNLLMIGVNAFAVFRRRLFGLLPFAFLNPFYWMLHSIAAYRALYQLIRNPFVWEKTPHGLSSSEPDVAIDMSRHHVQTPAPAEPVVITGSAQQRGRLPREPRPIPRAQVSTAAAPEDLGDPATTPIVPDERSDVSIGAASDGEVPEAAASRPEPVPQMRELANLIEPPTSLSGLVSAPPQGPPVTDTAEAAPIESAPAAAPGDTTDSNEEATAPDLVLEPPPMPDLEAEHERPLEPESPTPLAAMPETSADTQESVPSSHEDVVALSLARAITPAQVPLSDQGAELVLRHVMAAVSVVLDDPQSRDAERNEAAR